MSPRFTLRQLSCFVAVAETGSIARAAAQLHASESAVALAVTELERVLGTQLCVRRRARGVELTASGRDLLDRAAALLADAESLQTAVDDPVSGAVSIGCTRGLAPQLLPPIVAGCVAELPNVSLDFDLLQAPQLLERLAAGAVDVAIVSSLRVVEPLATRVLCRSPVHALLHQEHPLASRAEIDLRDLADEPCILLETAPAAEHAMAMWLFTVEGVDRAGASVPG